MQSLSFLLTSMKYLPDFSKILTVEFELSSNINVSALLCKFSILVIDLALASIHARMQKLEFDIFTRTFLSLKPKKFFNLTTAFSCFAAALQLWFICCSKLSSLFTSTLRDFTWDATLISLELILKILFVLSCFLLLYYWPKFLSGLQSSYLNKPIQGNFAFKF